MKTRFIIKKIITHQIQDSNGKFIQNKFEGSPITNDLALGTFYVLDNNEQILMEYDCRSGGWGKGPLEVGEYSIISLSSPQEIKKLEDRDAYTLFDFGWFARLIIKFQSERKNLGLHPDGNVPGSLGCGVFPFKNEEDNKKMHNFIFDGLKNGEIPFEVIQILNH